MPDLGQLGIGQWDVQTIGQYADTLDELLSKYTAEQMTKWRRFGPPGVERLAKALERWNDAHGTTYALRTGAPQRTFGGNFDGGVTDAARARDPWLDEVIRFGNDEITRKYALSVAEQILSGRDGGPVLLEFYAGQDPESQERLRGEARRLLREVAA